MHKSLILLSICFVFGCSERNTNNRIHAQKILTLNEYNANEYIINIEDIYVNNETVYLVEEGLPKIVVTNLELDHFSLFGNRGMGPKEIISPSIITTGNEKIYIYDKQRFKLFEFNYKMDLIRDEISFDKVLINSSILVEDSILLFTSPVEKDYDIERFDLNNEKQLSGFNLPNQSKKSSMGRSILKYKDEYIIIGSFSPPFIEMYNENWELLSSKDLLDDNESLQELLNERPTNNSGKKPEVTSGNARPTYKARMVIRDVSLKDNNLYLLTYRKNDDGINKSNSIFKYSYTDGEWDLDKEILLPDNGHYKSFAILGNNESIVAFEESRGELEHFIINSN